MLLPTFRGSVDALGRLRLEKPEQFKAYALTLANRKVVLTVGEEKFLRSQNQNRYMWGVVYKLIADYTGHSAEEIHEYLKAKFLSKRMSLKGRSIKIVPSTSSLTTVQFEDYLEKCRVFAAEMGVVVPMPNEIEIEI